MLNINLLQTGGKAALCDIDPELFRDKTILITGASGIVGTHFIYGLHYLQSKLNIPLDVIAVVSRGVAEHLKPLERLTFVTFVSGDLTDPAVMNSLPTADYVIHAATYGQPGKFMAFPEITIKLNTTVTLFLLEKIIRPDGKFLFISSSEVYSGLPFPPYHESQIGTTSPDHSRACYIEAKRCGEAITNIFRQKGIAAVSARLSLAYGPGTRSDDKRVLNNFIEKALVQKEIRMMDAGTSKRTYCFISDAVNMMWHILLNGTKPVYNVGGRSTVSIAQLAEMIGHITNVPVILPEDSAEGLSGAPDDVQLDLSRYVSEFGEPSFCDMGVGLEKTIEWQSSMFLK